MAEVGRGEVLSKAMLIGGGDGTVDTTLWLDLADGGRELPGSVPGLNTGSSWYRDAILDALVGSSCPCDD